MTLICLNSFPIPAMVGDLLLTGHPSKEVKILPSLPTLGPIEKLEKEHRGIQASSLVQKIVKLSPTVTVAWSGKWIAARRVLLDIRDYIERRNDISAENILEKLDSMDFPEMADVSILGMIARNDEKNTEIFQHNSGTINYPPLGTTFAGGSGAHELCRFLQETECKHFGPYPLFFAACCQLAGEFFSTKSLKNGFGGSYELAYATPEQVRKVDGITFAFWFLNEESFFNPNDSRLSFGQSPVFIKQFYFDDDLIIFRFEMPLKWHVGKSSLMKRVSRGYERFVAVTPFDYMRKRTISVPLNSLNKTELIFSFFAFGSKNGIRKICFTIDGGHSIHRAPFAITFDEKSRFTIEWQWNYFSRLLDNNLIGQIPTNAFRWGPSK